MIGDQDQGAVLRIHRILAIDGKGMSSFEDVRDVELMAAGRAIEVEIEEPDVYVTFTLTTPACPIGPQVSDQMKELVGRLAGVRDVHPKMIFDPPWSPEMMSEDAKFALGF